MDFYARLTSKTISQFPTLVAAHQAEVRGPPVGRGPQVENRCSIALNRLSLLISLIGFTIAIELPTFRTASNRNSLNSAKTKFMLLGTRQQLDKLNLTDL